MGGTVTQGSPALRANPGLSDGIPLGFMETQSNIPPNPEDKLASRRGGANNYGMSNLRSIDMRLLDEVFEMVGGYVLDFSDRTFREFFADDALFGGVFADVFHLAAG